MVKWMGWSVVSMRHSESGDNQGRLKFEAISDLFVRLLAVR